MFSVVGCVGDATAADDLTGDGMKDVRSTHGLVRADVGLKGNDVVRGKNDFVLAFSPEDPRAKTRLISAEAIMPAHGHGTTPAKVDRDGDVWVARDVNLFMAGRWEVTFGVEVADQSDAVRVTIDVQ